VVVAVAVGVHLETFRERSFYAGRRPGVRERVLNFRAGIGVAVLTGIRVFSSLLRIIL
jgi:hypothetical protein